MLSFVVAKAVHLVGARMLQFASIAIILIPLERLIPFHHKQRLFRRLFVLDLFHYFLGGIFIMVFVRLTYYGMPFLSSWAGFRASPFSIRNLPWWGQILTFEAGWTFLGYWLHRYEHINPILWRLHSIHESSEELDWLSAFRLHPLEPALFQVLTVVPLWFFGMDLPVAIGYKIYGYIFAHVQHSNIVFPIGPLKYVLPTPEFHRWHHARVLDANGKQIRAFRNFAEYPIWDLLFGTFYLPDERPTAYGNARNVPMDYMAQLAYPFGAHEKVLAWKRSLNARLNLADRLARLRQRITPVHDAFENRLARLCLLRTPEKPLMGMQPVLGKENA